MAFPLLDRWRTSWFACTKLDPATRERAPPRHTDYRDVAPPSLEDIYALHQPLIQDGRWTWGLLEMWFPQEKVVKHSTHMPCWDSFKLNPCRWRGVCFGRNLEECYWDGLRQTRWARTVYAANLGREYVLPVRGVGKHGYKSEIKALCWMYYLMGCIFSCGIGQVFSLCGNFCFNFGAVYSCHAREKLRRRYKLPPAAGCPPGIDDFLVHFFCFYCAVYQEMRELAVRGVDGPGLHILDVLPESYRNAPGATEAIEARRELVQKMLQKPPKMFKSRVKVEKLSPSGKKEEEEKGGGDGEKEVEEQRRLLTIEIMKRNTSITLQRAKNVLLGRKSNEGIDEEDGMSVTTSEGESEIGWASHCAPCAQEMSREVQRTHSLPRIEVLDLPLDDEERKNALKRYWSVAY